MTTTTSSPADPTKDPTAPSISKALMGLFGGTATTGTGLSVADWIQSGKIAWPGVVLALVGLAATAVHSTDVGRRFQTWLGSDHGKQFVSDTVAVAGQLGPVVDRLAAVESGNTHAGNMYNTLAARLAALEAAAANMGVTPDLLRQAADKLEGQGSVGGGSEPPLDPPADQPAPSSAVPPSTAQVSADAPPAPDVAPVAPTGPPPA